jgi:hypothetical protein
MTVALHSPAAASMPTYLPPHCPAAPTCPPHPNPPASSSPPRASICPEAPPPCPACPAASPPRASPCPEATPPACPTTTGPSSPPLAPSPPQASRLPFPAQLDALIERLLQADEVDAIAAEAVLQPGAAAAPAPSGSSTTRRASSFVRRLHLLRDQLEAVAAAVRARADPNALLGRELDEEFPDPTSMSCHMQADSSDICVYENACVDVPSDLTGPGDAVLHLVGSDHLGVDTVPSTLAPAPHHRLSPVGVSQADAAAVVVVDAGEGGESGGGDDDDGTESGSESSSSSSTSPPSPPSPSPADAAASAWASWQRARRHADRLASGHAAKEWGLGRVVREGLSDRLSWDFIDVVPEHPGSRPRAVPFGSRFLADIVRPEETVPRVLGGAFDGAVTWVDDLYAAQSVLHDHIWGFSQGVGFPLLGAGFANASLRLNLPPLANVFVAADQFMASAHRTTAWAAGHPYASAGTGAWITGLLESELRFLTGGADPFVGSGRPLRKQVPGKEGGATAAAAAAAAAAANADPGVPSSFAAAGDRAGTFPLGAAVAALVSEAAAAACGHPDARIDVPGFSTTTATPIGSRMVDGSDPLAKVAACLYRWMEAEGMGGGEGAGAGAEGSEGAAATKTNDDGGRQRSPAPRRTTPYRTLRADNTRPGTRVLFTSRDVPPSPVTGGLRRALEDAWAARDGGQRGPLSALASASALDDYAEHLPVRVCARRLVLAGNRDALVGGNAETTYVRMLGAQAAGNAVMQTQAYNYPPPRLLVVDRGNETRGSADGGYGRWFTNYAEMEAVLTKYGVEHTLLTDREIYGMTFEEQVRVFGRHGILVVAHGAGESTSAWMPPRSAVIEVREERWGGEGDKTGHGRVHDWALLTHTPSLPSPPLQVHPYGMWCPVFHRMHTSSGNQVFPIYSQLKAPNLDFAYVFGRPKDPIAYQKQAVEIAAKCDGLGHVGASRNPDCWHEYRTAAVTVPIHEFEHTLLLALDAIGVHTWPKNASIRLLEGEPNGGPDEPLAHADPDLYKRRRWGVCPPQQKRD